MNRSPLFLIALLAIAFCGTAIVSAQDIFATNTPVPTRTPMPSRTLSLPTGTIFVNVPIPEAEAGNGDGFEITGVLIERTLNTVERVSITVRSTGDAALSGLGWYLLTPAYITAPDAWRFAAFTAPTVRIPALPPGETLTLDLPGPGTDSPLMGEYLLSAWVHRAESDGTTRHADGLGFAQPLVIGPPLFLTIDHVDLVPPAEGESEHLLFVSFTLRNYTPQYAEIGYSYAIAAPETERPWEQGIFSLPYRTLIMLPGSTLNVTTRERISLPPGEQFSVTGYLQQNVSGSPQFRSSYLFPDLIGAVD
jgi:hypothetical protein